MIVKLTVKTSHDKITSRIVHLRKEREKEVRLRPLQLSSAFRRDGRSAGLGKDSSAGANLLRTMPAREHVPESRARPNRREGSVWLEGGHLTVEAQSA